MVQTLVQRCIYLSKMLSRKCGQQRRDSCRTLYLPMATWAMDQSIQTY